MLKKIMRTLFFSSFFLYCFIVLMLLLGTRPYFDYSASGMGFFEYVKSFTNFRPFRTISSYFIKYISEDGQSHAAASNLYGNLLLFLPMGFYLPCFSKHFLRFFCFLRTMLFIIIYLEALQLMMQVGFFDIDDILLNTLGAIIGFFLLHIPFMQNLFKELSILQ